MLLAFVLSKRVHLVAFLALSLRLGDFNFTIVDSVSESLLTGLGRLFAWYLLGLFCILTISLLHVPRAEIDELLTEVNVLLVRIYFKSFKLRHFPLSLLFFSLLAALFLPGFVLIFFLLSLFCQLLTCFITLTTLQIVLGLSLMLLGDHHLGLSYPLDVLDVRLLDLVVAHLAIEFLLNLTLFVDHGPLLLHYFVDLYSDVSQVVLF